MRKGRTYLISEEAEMGRVGRDIDGRSWVMEKVALADSFGELPRLCGGWCKEGGTGFSVIAKLMGIGSSLVERVKFNPIGPVAIEKNLRTPHLAHLQKLASAPHCARSTFLVASTLAWRPRVRLAHHFGQSDRYRQELMI